jgi:hypothetical protein
MILDTERPSLHLPRSVMIDSRRYSWRELIALAEAQAVPCSRQPSLFEMHLDYRPPGERCAAERYSEPSLFAA